MEGEASRLPCGRDRIAVTEITEGEVSKIWKEKLQKDLQGEVGMFVFEKRK